MNVTFYQHWNHLLIRVSRLEGKVFLHGLITQTAFLNVNKQLRILESWCYSLSYK